MEDPHIWRDERGRYHALLHGGPQPPPDHFIDVGYHAFSLDGKIWAFSEKPAFQSTVTTTDGKVHKFRRRERPKLLLDSHRRPIYMYVIANLLRIPMSPRAGNAVARNHPIDQCTCQTCRSALSACSVEQVHFAASWYRWGQDDHGMHSVWRV